MEKFYGTTSTKTNHNKSYIQNRYKITFQGEIYNLDEIKNLIPEYKNLPGFSNHEEIIYNCICKWDMEFPNFLNGIFSISVEDRENGSYYLIRDQIGLGHIYYTFHNNNLYYSSDIKTLLDLYKIPKEIDFEALNFFFSFRYVPGEKSIFKNIRKLSPGCILTFNQSDKKTEVYKYWNIPNTDPITEISEEILCDELEQLLIRSMIRRTNDHTDLGVFLSGGLDSSLNVALLSEVSDKRIKTFTVGFEDEEIDETKYAKIVSNYFNTESRQITLTPLDQIFHKLADIFEEPLGDPSIIPTYFASKLASGNCESVICGDGADANFLGLRTHILINKYKSLFNTLKYPKKIVSPITRLIPSGFKWKIFLEDCNIEEFFLKRRLNFDLNKRAKIFTPAVLEELNINLSDPEHYGMSILNSYNGCIEGKIGYFDFISDPDDIFMKITRLINFNSLNLRTPFLDKDLVEFSFNKLPVEMKIKNGISKYILKKVSKKYLPKNLPLERKRGFNPPVSKWLKDDWWNNARDIIYNGNDSMINRKYSDEILEKHKKKIYDEGKNIFCLIMYKLWETKYLD